LRKRLRGAAGSAATEEAFVQQRDPLPDVMLPSLISLMRMTQEEWDEWTWGSAIRRGEIGSPGALTTLRAALAAEREPFAIEAEVARRAGALRGVAIAERASFWLPPRAVPCRLGRGGSRAVGTEVPSRSPLTPRPAAAPQPSRCKVDQRTVTVMQGLRSRVEPLAVRISQCTSNCWPSANAGGGGGGVKAKEACFAPAAAGDVVSSTSGPGFGSGSGLNVVPVQTPSGTKSTARVRRNSAVGSVHLSSAEVGARRPDPAGRGAFGIRRPTGGPCHAAEARAITDSLAAA
jgi:hypothetical protein